MSNTKHSISPLIVVAFVLAGGIFSSCQKDIDETIDLNAVIDENSGKEAKVVIDNARYACWSNDDTVSINGVKYLVSVGSTSGTTIAKIEGVKKNNNGYAAVYPYSCHDNESAGSNTATIKLPDVQKWSSTHITTPMVAYTTGSTLTFHNPCNLLKVTLTNTTSNELQIHQIIVSSNHTKLSGTATITGIDGDTPTVEGVTGGTNDVTLDCDDAVLGTSTPLTFYVTVPNCSGEQFRFRVLAKNGSTKYTFDDNSQSGINLTQNQMVPIAVTLSSSTPNAEALFWGSGTASNPYLITDLNDLDNFRKECLKTTTTTYKNKCFLQTVDLDASASEWDNCTLSGSSTINGGDFYGTYDGGNHNLSLKLNLIKGGLFHILKDATVKNLTLNGPDCSVTYNTSYTSSFGALSSSVLTKTSNKTTIQNVHNNINISATYTGVSTNHIVKLGGLVGYTNYVACTFNNCSNNGNMTGKGKYGTNVGGIVGYIAYSNNTFTSCSNDGEITGQNSTGGILGRSYGTNSNTVEFSNCKNKEEAIIDGNYNVGGIAGSVESTSSIFNNLCSNTGKVVGTFNVAGILGFATYNSSFENCNNDGDIEATSNDNGDYGVAGILGRSSNGSVSINKCNNTHLVKASEGGKYIYAAGIAGFTEGTTTIKNCGNTGTINVTNVRVASGIVGRTKNATIANCYNSGIFTGSGSDGEKACVAGIVGVACTTATKINNCYNKVDVSGVTADQKYSIAGAYSGTLSLFNCYGPTGASSPDLTGEANGASSPTINEYRCTKFNTTSGNLDNPPVSVNTLNNSDDGTDSYGTLKDALDAWVTKNGSSYSTWGTGPFPTF